MLIATDKEEFDIKGGSMLCLRSPFSFLNQRAMFPVESLEKFRESHTNFFNLCTGFKCDPIISSLRELYKIQKDKEIRISYSNEEELFILETIIEYFSKLV